MEVLFTKRSKLIYWALREPVTHVAIRYYDWVIHSNSKGVNVEFYKNFCELNPIIYRVSHPVLFKNLMGVFVTRQDRGYDFLGAAYLGLRAVFKRVGISLPKANLWEVTGMDFCSELVADILKVNNSSDLTPYQLYLLLNKDYLSEDEIVH